MKTIGMIGGLGPESTIDYYQRMIAAYRERQPDDSYPPIIINSVNMTRVRELTETNELGKLVDLLVAEIEKLARAGAECGMISANSPHLVFDEVNRRSPIPLVSIVEATCEEAKKRGLRRLGLLGTRFTMQGRFFPEVFSRERMTLITPAPAEQEYIHEIYFRELVAGKFLPKTRQRLLTIAQRMIEQDGVKGVILAGTELPLILRESSYRGVPFLDTTGIHVKAMLDYAMA